MGAWRRTGRGDAGHCLCSGKSSVCPQKLTVLCSPPSDLLLSLCSSCFVFGHCMRPREQSSSGEKVGFIQTFPSGHGQLGENTDALPAAPAEALCGGLGSQLPPPTPTSLIPLVSDKAMFCTFTDKCKPVSRGGLRGGFWRPWDLLLAGGAQCLS